MNKNCLYCGKEFEESSSRAKKFCCNNCKSYYCQNKGSKIKKEIIKNCSCCGKRFVDDSDSHT